MTLYLDGTSLTVEDCAAVAAGQVPAIALSAAACEAVERSRAIVEKWVKSGRVIYGVTTGFGEFSDVSIPSDDLELLQENLVMSHSVGTGDWLPREVVRTMLLLRINALARGYSGIRLKTLNTLIAMLNHDIVPAVPSQGSVGSSGDLVQLSHIALSAIGQGRCLTVSGTEPAANALARHGIKPVRLQAKEGLALINGTQMMCAFGALALAKAEALAEVADITGAMSLEALRGTDTAFDERLQLLRGYRGQSQCARNLRSLLRNSAIRESHRDNDGKVQDAYSLRCMPQVHGASRDAFRYVREVIQIEINSVNDNPIIVPDEERHIEGGNFHGQPLALALDFLAIAAAELANISERRIERLVNGSLSGGLPRFLAKNGGLHSGLMIAQYNAASLVSENKVLAHPASVDSIPTSANQEDHNSMGSIAAQKAWRVVHNLERVLAIELLSAAQGIDFLRPLQSSEQLEAVHRCVREEVSFNDADRVLYDDVEAVRRLIATGKVAAASQLS